MTREEMEQTLLEIVRKEKLTLSEGVIAPQTLLADAGIDSLDALTILFAIEEHFSISIPDSAARQVKTFGDLANVVASELRLDA